MALSNWDTLAFDAKGEPGDGRAVLPSGGRVELYKNWLYVGHEKMWVPGGPFTQDTIASVYGGVVSLAGFHITAIRGSAQDSIFCYVEAHNEPLLCGIACAGNLSTLDWLKRYHPGEFERLTTLHGPLDEADAYSEDDVEGQETSWGLSLLRLGPGGTWHDATALDIPLQDLPALPEGSLMPGAWLGVTPLLLASFLEWLATIAPAPYLEKIRAAKALRFNQGDAFFADAMGLALPATIPGEPEPPLLGKLVTSLDGST